MQYSVYKLSLIFLICNFKLCFFCVCAQELPLYCSGGLRFFWDNKFDHAMVAFLDCVQQFKEEVEKGDTGFCLPYRSENCIMLTKQSTIYHLK